MAIYPGAVFKPTGYGGRTPRNRQGRGILHVAVSGARSLPPWNGNTWHFYIAKDGYCEQYVDTEFRAYANGDANDDAISIETAGGLGSSAVLNAEEWTPAQMDRIADIMRWEAAQPGGAPLELLPDSKPGRRGWGSHRLGVQHSRGVGAVPGWLVAGGERWSSAIGKECPGDAKIRQIPTALNMARGAQEDDMPLTDDDIRRLFNYGFQKVDANGKPTGRGVNLAQFLIWDDAKIASVLNSVASLQGQVAGLTTALAQVAKAPGQAVDLEAVEEASFRGSERALAQRVNVDITVGGKDA